MNLLLFLFNELQILELPLAKTIRLEHVQIIEP
jgi:hypothetical protein